ncbi:MAG: hypothetical protein A3E37_02635 [Candidatus Andersenbacteria bacterium RIFCSPHIGHO2_12_FULL_46_9]|nr:MAG: hypothetical protein A3E37_02635 [Candidatus Andersenbacteria bacterium RIFCSPHIGHO2_12_FULL_46_9]HBE90635.1 hypothetical protein [Candidatus Andersenbacteria bacterium]
MFMYYIYILRMENNKLYAGHTYDLQKSLAEHNRGGVSATQNNRPVRLVLYAAFETDENARQFEKYLKALRVKLLGISDLFKTSATPAIPVDPLSKKFQLFIM